MFIKALNVLIKKHSGVIIASLILLLFTLSYSLKIDFMQNDDWYYYLTVEDFIQGKFILSSEIAPTLYLQIIMVLPYVLIFGISNLPVITLIVSILCFALTAIICVKHFKLNKFLTILVSLMMFFNPIFNYSIWGFMTENYFLFLFLVTLYFYNNYLKSGNSKDLLLANIFSLLGFFIRQVSLAFYLGTSAYFLLTKKIKLAFQQFVWFLLIYGFYEFIFPRTLEMKEKSIQLENYFEKGYFFAITIGALIYLVSFMLPVVWVFIIRCLSSVKNKTLYFLVAALSVLIYVLIIKYFKPNLLSWGEFPYFSNVFERKGFYPRSINGTKYGFMGIHDLYYYWDIVSKISLSLLLSTVIIVREIRQKLLNPFLIMLFVYIAVLVSSRQFFDRYLLEPFILLLFFFAGFLESEWAVGKNKFLKVIGYLFIVPFVIFLGFLCYQFTNDFISVESFVWQSSSKLVKQGVPPDKILGSSAWNEKYQRSREVKYVFSFDSMEVNPDLRERYNLVDTHEVQFPLSIYVRPKVYLYEKKTEF